MFASVSWVAEADLNLYFLAMRVYCRLNSGTTEPGTYATVSKSGKVKAKQAGKGKKVTITAMATDGSGKKAKVKIKIK